MPSPLADMLLDRMMQSSLSFPTGDQKIAVRQTIAATQLKETIDAFPRFHLIPVEARIVRPEIGLYLPPLAIVINDLWDLKKSVVDVELSYGLAISVFVV